jgi:hypothetical protein
LFEIVDTSGFSNPVFIIACRQNYFKGDSDVTIEVKQEMKNQKAIIRFLESQAADFALE